MFYIVTIAPDGKIDTTEQNKCPTIFQLQQAVGGYCERVPHWRQWDNKDCVALFDEDGKMKDLPINETATGFWIAEASRQRFAISDVIRGPVVIITADTPAEMRQL